MHLTKAEAELDWLFSIAPRDLEIGCQNYDPMARGDVPGWEHTDRQIATVTRSKPIRRALLALSRRDQTILRLRYEPVSFRGTDFSDYWAHYEHLAAIVKHYRPKGATKAEKRLRAQTWVAEAIRRYRDIRREHRGERKAILHRDRAGQVDQCHPPADGSDLKEGWS